MNISVEVETKYSISGESDFRRFLCAAGSPASVREQVNAYLDGQNGDLCRMGWMARLRLVDKGAVLTLKRAVDARRGVDGVFRAVEVEVAVPRDTAVACLQRSIDRGCLDPGPQAPREVRDLFLSGLVTLVTWSFTVRWTFRDPGQPDLVADETWFPDGSRDFEVEVECDDPIIAQARAQTIAAVAGIQLTPQTMTKHQRAKLRTPGGVLPPVPLPWRE